MGLVQGQQGIVEAVGDDPGVRDDDLRRRIQQGPVFAEEQIAELIEMGSTHGLVTRKRYSPNNYRIRSTTHFPG